MHDHFRPTEAVATSGAKSSRLRLTGSRRIRYAAMVACGTIAIAGTALVTTGLTGSSGSQRESIAAGLAARAIELEPSDPTLAAQLAIASYHLAPGSVSEGALFQTAEANTAVTRIVGGTGSGITALAEDSSGQILYAASADGDLQCWNMETGQMLGELRTASPVEELTASPVGQGLIGTDQNGDVLMWRTGGPSCLSRTLTLVPYIDATYQQQPVLLSYSPDEHSFYVIYADGEFGHYNASNGATIRETYLSLSKGTTLTAASSAGETPTSAPGLFAYATTNGQQVLRIDLTTLAVRKILSSADLPASPTSIAYEPGEANIVTISGTSGVTVWNLQDGQQLTDYPVNAVAAEFDLQDSAILVMTTTGVSTLAMPGYTSSASQGATQPQQLFTGAVQALAAPANAGGMIAAGTADGSISIINPAAQRLSMPSAPASTIAAFGPRDELILDNLFGTDNRTDSLYAIRPGASAPPGSGEYTTVKSYYAAPSWWPVDSEFFANDAAVEGNLLAVAGQSPSGRGVLLVWNVLTGQPLREILLPGRPTLGVDVAFDQRLGLVIVRDSNGQVDAWSTASWRQVLQLSLGSDAGSLTLSPTGVTALVPVEFGDVSGAQPTLDGKLALINLRTHVLHEIQSPFPFYRAAFAPDGQRIALIGQQQLQFLAPDGRRLPQSTPILLPGQPVDLAYSPNSSLLAVTLADGRTLIYGTSTDALAFPPLPAETGTEAVNVAWSSSGSELAVALGQASGSFVTATTTKLWVLDPAIWASQECTLADGNLSQANWERYVGHGVPYAAYCRDAPSATPHALAVSLRDVTWSSLSVPGTPCGIAGAIQLNQGTATVSTPRWGSVQVSAVGAVTYGYLPGTHVPAAALNIWCNAGGTAGSEVGQGYVIYDAVHRRLSVVTVLTAQHKTPASVAVPYLTKIVFASQAITTYEAWYTGHDALCCPTGRAITTWRYSAGTLHPFRTQVVS